ncbi:hypothetical protein BGW80DRAFT_1562789 [Lactifluus volemus]|nr:hypothetical protein BGW80DRAFT_1562789 [Lactifluus volemus]
MTALRYPISRGYSISPGATSRGNKLLLMCGGYAFNRTADIETIRKIKEKLCYVSHDLDMDTRLAEGDHHAGGELHRELPDGRTIKVSSERFEVPECMFQPHLVNIKHPGVAEMHFETIRSAAVDVRAGAPPRKMKQLSLMRVLNRDPSRLNKFNIRIEDPPRRKHIVFLGGVIFGGNHEGTRRVWVSRANRAYAPWI